MINARTVNQRFPRARSERIPIFLPKKQSVITRTRKKEEKNYDIK